ncbi:MAG: Gfo/Idh/MocA family oxidoreductase [Eubacteriales bacterium]|nr:Gfo/Idh/MocA family oxidoreductase [Eubacteriales bacterium]
MLRIGIIGCGKITQVRHAPEYAENSQCRLTAFYDFLPERARDLVAIYGGQAYDSVDALLDSGVDAVSVCVANADHAAVSIKALQKGVHVLCEKPMATTLADCETMARTARDNNLTLMLGHNQRLAKAHVEARKRVEAGEIGQVISFHTTFGHPGPEGWTGQKNSWFFDKNRAAFGALADLGIHKTDLLHYLLGESIISVKSTFRTLDKKFPDGTPISVDDNAFCIYRTQSGATGQMHVSWTFYGQEDNSTILYGTKGILRCYADPTYSLIVEHANGETEKLALDELTTNEKQTTGGRVSTGVIDTFIHSVLTGEKSVCDSREALKAMRVIFAAERSSLEDQEMIIEQ